MGLNKYIISTLIHGKFLTNPEISIELPHELGNWKKIWAPKELVCPLAM